MNVCLLAYSINIYARFFDKSVRQKLKNKNNKVQIESGASPIAIDKRRDI